MEETQINCQSPSNWGSIQDLTSWSFNDHENGAESAQNHTGVRKRLNELFSTSYPNFCQSITYQSGFKRGHSTETALLSVTEALRIAKADSKSSVLNLLDLSAAFDTVNHQILMSTLSSLGITGIPLSWSYRNDRLFRLAWGGEVSTENQLVTGVPQGSVLGPLLFSTYITSLVPIIQAHGLFYHCYADDTQLYLSFWPDDPTVAARISGCLADISAWMKEHHLQLNLAKTELFVCPATPNLQHDFTTKLRSSTITLSSSVRKLGVIFDDQLTFKDHIAKTARSFRFALHNIRKIRPFLTHHAAQLLVQALVIFRLDYFNVLLAGLHHAQSNLYRWFRMQRHDWSSANRKGPMSHLPLLPALAPGYSSHQVQDTDACI